MGSESVPTRDEALAKRVQLEELERQFIAAKDTKAGVTRSQKEHLSEVRGEYRSRYRPYAPSGVIVLPATVAANAAVVELGD